MSYLIAAPEFVSAAATDLAHIGETISHANAAAAPSTETVLAAGALDVFFTPVQMKKSRPGVLLTVLCAEGEVDKFAELLLRETSAFGIRCYAAGRRKLQRGFLTAQTPYGSVIVKIGKLDGKVLQVAPEFESCKKLAEQAKVPIKEVYEAALRAFHHLPPSQLT